MRQAYRLLGLVKKWGPEKVELACARALEAEAVNVNLIARMIERATEADDRMHHRNRTWSRAASPGTPPSSPPPPRWADERAHAEHLGRAEDHPVAAAARPDDRHPARATGHGPAVLDAPHRLLGDGAGRRGGPAGPHLGRGAGQGRPPRSDHGAEAWDDTAAVIYDRAVWAELTTLRFVDENHNALILGPVGVGKTFLATALGHIACRRRYRVHFERADKLFKRLKAARLDKSADAEMRKLVGVDLLMIDDFALHPLDVTETNDFYELVVERHRKGATVITSNRDPSEFLAQMADPLLAQSAVDRLQSAAYELVIEGESYRKRQKPQTTQATPVTRLRGTPQAHRLTPPRRSVSITVGRHEWGRGGPMLVAEGWSHQGGG